MDSLSDPLSPQSGTRKIPLWTNPEDLFKAQSIYIMNLEKENAMLKGQGKRAPEKIDTTQPDKADDATCETARSEPHTPKDTTSPKDVEKTAQGVIESKSVSAWPDVRFQKSKSKKSGEKEITDIDPSDSELGKEETLDKAITCLKKFDEDDNYRYTQLEIHDKGLRALIQIVLQHCQHIGLHLRPENSLQFDSPYEDLIHNWATLEALADNHEDHTTVKSFQEKVAKIKSLLDTSSSPWPENIREFARNDEMIQDAREKLRILLDVAKTEPKYLQPYFTQLARKSEDRITFEYLWTIFRPGDIVISDTCFNEAQAFIVNHSVEAVETEMEESYWPLICWAYDYDGSTFKRVAVLFKIGHFKTPKAITELTVYPIQYLPTKQQEDLKRSLGERGRRFKELCLKEREDKMFEYSSDRKKQQGDPLEKSSDVSEQTPNEKSSDVSEQTLNEKPKIMLSVGAIDRGSMKSSHDQISLRDEEYDSRRKTPPELEINDGDPVVVDFERYKHRGHRTCAFMVFPMGNMEYSDVAYECRCDHCEANDALRENQKVNYDLDPSKLPDDFETLQYQLCPPRVVGFYLKGKRWAEVKVSNLNDIEKKNNNDEWNHLELQPESKDLIRRLVQSHTSGKKTKNDFRIEDFVKNKGAGLVMLLHGPPGVGKTLAAEVVAQTTRKPLLHVTPGDLGPKSSDMERNMQLYFELASSWQAVMLVDEADVFIEARSDYDIERNASVATFLRILELYDGILILTTNRLRSADHAMVSRIHLGVEFKSLSERQKINIFENLLRRLSDDKVEDRKGIIEWVQLDEIRNLFEHLNGRQIRNILTLAVTLASGRDKGDKKLKANDIDQMARATKGFNDDLHHIVELARHRAEIRDPRPR